MEIVEILKPILPPGWKFEKSGNLFLEVYPEKYPEKYPDWGWKVRLNSTCLSAFKKMVIGGAENGFRANIPFKVAIGEMSFRNLHAKTAHPEIAGKAFTFYPGEKNNDLVSLIKQSDTFMKTLNVPQSAQPWSDRRHGRNLSYRWGSYVPGVADRRDTFFLPPGIIDPFSAATAPPPEPTPVIRMQGYELTVTECLYRHWGGSVYFGRAGSEDIICKEARPDAYIGCEALATDLLRNEVEVLNAIANETSDIAPKPLEFFQMNHHFFLVMTRFPGCTLKEWGQQHNNASPKRILNIARAISKKLSDLHLTVKTAHLDISPSNVIVGAEAEDDIRLIDFELSFRNAPAAAFAEDAKNFGLLLQWLAGSHKVLPRGYREAMQIAEEGGAMDHIFNTLLCAKS